jgi:D-alanyl-lipoteichoic acid acyltransferase DltB (MBOAT superfamily)
MLVPLGLAAGAAQLLSIEKSLQLPALMWLIVGGFAVHAWLPMKLRLPFFLALNVAALLVLLEPLPGLMVVGFGLSLIVLANLPIAWHLRVGLVLIAAAGLAAIKAGWIGSVASYQAVSVVAGLFMFRLILFLYESRHLKTTVSAWQKIAYFFLLPNLVFMIFPVVDYKTFVRNHYSQPAADTCAKGLRWVFAGLLHLMIYRVIYQYAIPAADAVTDPGTLVTYLVFSYALIIRLSGIFHLSVGIICLFGFDLPRTFNNYFLASGFSDLWRRINTYWRDFIMRTVYTPIYLRFKRRTAATLFVTVLMVFVVNWFLHSYQWFWIRGNFPVHTTDMLFWGIFGFLVACNSVLAMRAKPVKAKPGFSWADSARQSLKVVGMFSFMCLIWSLWNSPSVDAWWSLIRIGASGTAAEWGRVVAGLGLGFAGLLAGQYAYSELKNKKVLSPLRFRPASVVFTASGVVVCALALPSVSTAIGKQFSVDVTPLVTDSLNRRDAELLHTSYYEDLIAANGLNSRLWELEEKKKGGAGEDDWQGIREADVLIPTDTIAENILVPNYALIFKGAKMSTNEYGMRDRSYSLEKPPNTYRIALLGGSIEMGSGVEDHETFENVAEDRINAEGSGHQNLEILNFAIGGHYAANFIERAREIVDAFQVDALILVLHDANEVLRNTRVILRLDQKGLLDDYPEIQEILDEGRQARASGLPEAQALRRISGPLFRSVLGEYSKIRNEFNIALAVVYVESTQETTQSPLAFGEWLERGLMTENIFYWNYSNVFSEAVQASATLSSKRDLWIRPWDKHPNAIGHEIIAERLIQDIRNELIGTPTR